MTNHNMNKECRISKIGTGSPKEMKDNRCRIESNDDYLKEMSKQKKIQEC